MSSALRITHGIMAALFTLSALVQFNDPNPAPWITLYLAAAIAAGLTAARLVKPGMILAGLVLLICIASEIPYVQVQAWKTPFMDLTEEWHMTSEGIVDGREFYALIWIGGWMAFALHSLRRYSISRRTSSDD
ncbi:MAG: hypothetical protein SynsKO_10700 [Synoicihabitans sp.]